MTLTKNDIVNKINATGIPKNIAEEGTEHIIEILKKTLIKGEDVLITGFGKFIVKKKKERKGRNPATGKDLMLEKRRVVTFKCSKKLKKDLNS